MVEEDERSGKGESSGVDCSTSKRGGVLCKRAPRTFHDRTAEGEGETGDNKVQETNKEDRKD